MNEELLSTTRESARNGLRRDDQFRVAYTQEFPSLRETFEAERQLKGWRREKKASLIRGDWDALQKLARSYLSLSILRGPQDDI